MQKEIAGKKHYAKVTLSVKPLPRDQGFLFESQVKTEELPTKFLEAVQEGVEEGKDSGPFMGYPMRDLKATLLKALFKKEEASAIAFKAAARKALREASFKSQSACCWNLFFQWKFSLRKPLPDPL